MTDGGPISFVVPGPVVPKARPRFANGRTYTPAKTAAYEKVIAVAAKIELAGREMPTGPVAVTVDAVLAVPKSWNKTKTMLALDGAIRPSGSREDLDNIVKVALDGCNKILWADDRQVCEIRATKAYGPEPFLMVSVKGIAE